MYKVFVLLMVNGKFSREFQFDCQSVTKDIIQQNISRLTSVQIGKLELVYLDSEEDEIYLSSDGDYSFALLEATNENHTLKIIAKTDDEQPMQIVKKKTRKQISAEEKPFQLQRAVIGVRDKGKEPKKSNKGNFNVEFKQLYHEIKANDKLEEQTSKLPQYQLEQIHPKMKKKEKRKLELQIMRDDLRILKATNQTNFKDKAMVQKKEQTIKQEPIEIDLKDDGQDLSVEQISIIEQDSQLCPPIERDYIKILNNIQKLKRNLKRQILAELPNYLKKQCFNTIPYQIKKIAQQLLCFSCQKKLKQLPLPIYINNKNEFYCSDCEGCLADDDELLVKIKSEKLRQQIFLVKCVPVLRSEIQYLQRKNYSSMEQKYLEIIKQSKRIALQKLNQIIFKQQERTIRHNRLMKDQERKHQSKKNEQSKKGNNEYKLHKAQRQMDKFMER